MQARLDGFTFNKLKPYEKWEIFFKEARTLWDLYIKAANPLKITRIALRYVNRIEIPLPVSDFKEYIKTIPEIAPSLPYKLERFFMQFVMPNNEIEATAIITQTIEPPAPNQKRPLIFDIDVWKLTDYKGNTEEMWEVFEKLRMFKNEIFNESITEKAKELFQ